MGDTRIQVIIDAVDNASSVFKKVGDQLGGLSSSMGGAVDASKKLAIALGIGAGGLVAAGTFAVAQAKEHIATQKQLEAVLLSTKGAAGLFAEDINDQAQAIARLTNYTDDTVVAGQNLLLTFTNVKGPIFQEATQAIVDMSTAMGQDLKSSAIEVGKALNDPVEGMTALRRVGVTFSQEQQDVIAKFIETGKVADAQRVILNELAKEFGGSAAAVADPLTQLKNRITELAEDLGVKLMPAVNMIAGVLNDWIDKTITIVGWLKEHNEIVIVFAGAIMGALIPALVAWGITLMTVTIPALISAAVALAPFMLAGALIAGLVLGVKWVITNHELLGSKIHEVWTAVTGFLKGIWDEITGIFKAGVDRVTAIAQPFIALAQRVMDAARSIGSALGSAGHAVGGLLGFASGGMVPGPAGMAQLAIVHGGERVIPNSGVGAGIGGGINVSINNPSIGSDVDIDRLAERVGDSIMGALRQAQVI